MASQRPLTICYYCTGHGWGHATRSSRVILALLHLGHTVHVSTVASPAAFDADVRAHARFRPVDLEARIVQPVAYRVDRDASLENLRALLARRDELVRGEAGWLVEVGADVVVCDAPFLPCAAAKQAGAPAVLVTNFTFDEIYRGFLSPSPSPADTALIQALIAEYACATTLLRLPGAIRMPAFDGADAPLVTYNTPPQPGAQIEDIPLVTRPLMRRRDDVLAGLGVPPALIASRKFLIVTFGFQALDVASFARGVPEGWCVLYTSPVTAAAATSSSERVIAVPQSTYIPDLIAAGTAVLGKLGYGTCAECVAAERPLIYVSRAEFVEERGLEAMMQAWGACVQMSLEEFEGGEWGRCLEVVEDLIKGEGVVEGFREKIGVDGDAVAARRIVEIARRPLPEYGRQEHRLL